MRLQGRLEEYSLRLGRLFPISIYVVETPGGRIFLIFVAKEGFLV